MNSNFILAWIKNQLIEQRISKTDCALRADVCRGQLIQILNGKTKSPGIATLEQIVRALGAGSLQEIVEEEAVSATLQEDIRKPINGFQCIPREVPSVEIFKKYLPFTKDHVSFTTCMHTYFLPDEMLPYAQEMLLTKRGWSPQEIEEYSRGKSGGLIRLRQEIEKAGVKHTTILQADHLISAYAQERGPAWTLFLKRYVADSDGLLELAIATKPEFENAVKVMHKAFRYGGVCMLDVLFPVAAIVRPVCGCEMQVTEHQGLVKEMYEAVKRAIAVSQVNGSGRRRLLDIADYGRVRA